MKTLDARVVAQQRRQAPGEVVGVGVHHPQLVLRGQLGQGLDQLKLAARKERIDFLIKKQRDSSLSADEIAELRQQAQNIRDLQRQMNDLAAGVGHSN